MSLLARLVLAIALLPSTALAEPYLAAQMGFKCGQCHVNPSGGGMRNAFGNSFAQMQMPERQILKDAEPWTGLLGKYFAVGGDLRANYNYNDVPNTDEENSFDVEEGRVYLEASIIPGRLSVYVDELVAPGNADNREANVRFWIRENALYVKAGRMYLPFGWRLEDDTAFTRQLSGINMTTPDNGAEIGFESGPWTAQLAISNGSAGGPEEDTGKQASLRAEYVQPVWRVGVSASTNNAEAGDREAFAIHGAIRTGPVVWLGEVDYVKDDSLLPLRDQYAALGEANWRIRAGHNLKLTFEYFEPDDDVDEDEQTRTSLVYEWTPVEFLQFRLGGRVYDGIPQNNQQNRKLYFLQMHGFF